MTFCFRDLSRDDNDRYIWGLHRAEHSLKNNNYGIFITRAKSRCIRTNRTKRSIFCQSASSLTYVYINKYLEVRICFHEHLNHVSGGYLNQVAYILVHSPWINVFSLDSCILIWTYLGELGLRYRELIRDPLTRSCCGCGEHDLDPSRFHYSLSRWLY